MILQPAKFNLVNGNYPNGYDHPSGERAITSSGVNIGSYAINSLGYVLVRVSLPDHQCGRRLLAFVVEVTYDDRTIQGTSSVESVAQC